MWENIHLVKRRGSVTQYTYHCHTLHRTQQSEAKWDIIIQENRATKRDFTCTKMRRRMIQKDISASKRNLIKSVSTCEVCAGEARMIWVITAYSFLARVRIKRFSALKRKVIRLCKGGQWTLNGDSPGTQLQCFQKILYVWNRYWQTNKKKKNITCDKGCMFLHVRTAEWLCSTPSWDSLCNKVIQSYPRETAHTILHMHPLWTQSCTCDA